MINLILFCPANWHMSIHSHHCVARLHEESNYHWLVILLSTIDPSYNSLMYIGAPLGDVATSALPMSHALWLLHCTSISESGASRMLVGSKPIDNMYSMDHFLTMLCRSQISMPEKTTCRILIHKINNY